MRILWIYLVFNLQSTILNSQIVGPLWTKGIGGPDFDFSESVVADANGNVFTFGTFRGTVDFDPGPGTYNLTSSGSFDIYILKLDSSGNFLWAMVFGSSNGDFAREITLDPNGNILIFGEFNGPIDFDPGPNIYTLAPIGSTDVFITKLSSSGAFLWAKEIGGSNLVTGVGLSQDRNGNIFLTGSFFGTVDFDPGIGAFTLSSSGWDDAYVLKLNSSGNFVWAKQIGGIFKDYSFSVTNDISGNVYYTGGFNLTADFDPGPGTYNLTSAGGSDIFISKLDASGNFIWAKQLGSAGDEDGRSVISDGSGIYFTGWFRNSVDFDPGPGNYNLTSSGGSDAFVSKLDAIGNFVWAKQLGGVGGEIGYSIALDASGNIYTTGSFNLIGDFDPGPGVYNLTSAGSSDIFISCLNPIGDFIQAIPMGSPADDDGRSITTDLNGNVYVVGTFSNTSDFYSCNGGNILTSAGLFDNFVSKFGIKKTDITITSFSPTICPGAPVTFIATTINAGSNPVFQWKVNGNNIGVNNDTLIVTTLTNNDIVSAIVMTNFSCGPSMTDTSNSIVINFSSPITPTVSISTPRTDACAGTVLTFSSSTTNGGLSPAYQWKVNGNNVGINSPAYSTNNLVNGDAVSLLMTSSDLCTLPNSVLSNSIIINIKDKVVPSVIIRSTPDKFCPGDLVTFNATQDNGGTNPTYRWQINGVPSGGNNSSFTINNFKDGDIINCVMTSSDNCVNSTNAISNNIVINIDVSACPNGFYMPTAFTPDNNGKNDLCRPLLFGDVVYYKFQIFNRWGMKVFESAVLNDGWDGRLSNIYQSTNTFVWFCAYQFRGQAVITKKGTVMLIR